VVGNVMTPEWMGWTEVKNPTASCLGAKVYGQRDSDIWIG
jgi:hypothetical protein